MKIKILSIAVIAFLASCNNETKTTDVTGLDTVGFAEKRDSITKSESIISSKTDTAKTHRIFETINDGIKKDENFNAYTTIEALNNSKKEVVSFVVEVGGEAIKRKEKIKPLSSLKFKVNLPESTTGRKITSFPIAVVYSDGTFFERKIEIMMTESENPKHK